MRPWISRLWKRWLEFGSIQKAATSYALHDFDYRHYSVEDVRKGFEGHEATNLFNHPCNRLLDLCQRHPEIRDTAVDMGCGAGWVSARLSRDFRRVIAIEPSEKAIALAREIFPASAYPNIEWRIGFAEEQLRALSLQTPALFVTAVVLSHLLDEEVSTICSALNAVAPAGSILSFSENWGTEFHKFMWHVRTPEWWQAQLPGWELDFHGPVTENPPGRNRGFHGRKRG
jgi:SAM-dependent methyltransferase